MTKKKEFYDIWLSVCVRRGARYVNEKLRGTVIFFILEGKLSITVKDCDPIIVCENQIVLAPYGITTNVEILENLHCIACYFDINELLSSGYFQTKELIPLKKHDIEDRVLEFREIISDYLTLMEKYIQEKEETFEFYNLKRQEFFYLLFSRYSQLEISKFFFPIVGEDMKFRELVLNNYLKVKTVEELASLAHCSTSGFIKRFKKNFDESPYKWISQKKSEEILLELESGMLTFQEIADKYNFSSYRTFLFFCKSQFGSSPSEIILKHKDS